MFETRFSLCISYRHNATICYRVKTCHFWDYSQYINKPNIELHNLILRVKIYAYKYKYLTVDKKKHPPYHPLTLWKLNLYSVHEHCPVHNGTEIPWGSWKGFDQCTLTTYLSLCTQSAERFSGNQLYIKGGIINSCKSVNTLCLISAQD